MTTKPEPYHLLAVLFVGWVMRRLRERGYIAGGFDTTDEGETLDPLTIEEVRRHMGERPFANLVCMVTGADKDTCEATARLARHHGLIADSYENVPLEEG